MASSSGCALGEDGSSFPGAVVRDARVSPSEVGAAAEAPDHRFPRDCKLTARRQFLAVYEHGKRVSAGTFVLFGVPTDLPTTRIGFTVTRKIGNAVQRNRIKRRLREVFRRRRAVLVPSFDIVINARQAVLECSLLALERDLLGAFSRLKSGGRR
jgi:ribonuclease P protein component